MRRAAHRARRALAAGLLLGSVVASGAGPSRADDPAPPPLGVGDSIPAFTLEDQHGEPREVDARTRVILFSRDMKGGDVLKAALAELPEGTLDAAGAVYVSDISGMPRLIARLFAVPSMRRRPYPMLLDRLGEATVFLPDEPGRATLIHLDALQIRALEHLASPEEVRVRLLAGSAAPPPPTPPPGAGTTGGTGDESEAGP